MHDILWRRQSGIYLWWRAGLMAWRKSWRRKVVWEERAQPPQIFTVIDHGSHGRASYLSESVGVKWGERRAINELPRGSGDGHSSLISSIRVPVWISRPVIGSLLPASRLYWPVMARCVSWPLLSEEERTISFVVSAGAPATHARLSAHPQELRKIRRKKLHKHTGNTTNQAGGQQPLWCN